ncbi:hypothetical protein PPN31114_03488 [Pandoraea pneumonica]|jgi:hypothetical protein|uniref:DUF2846 domain-containing protein n=1 Tax=Pandoraea pneumonica TaxID=2508299 RepID=A0A5E4WVA7_9BURK|nr:DUF2846 domain-containing protein [Pandoraea pneumonica]VVE27749.1 hypothetical protein PPN31114_03488 [Pandoraea pneumonica]
MKKISWGFSTRHLAIGLMLVGSQLLSACGAIGPAFQAVQNVPEDKALVYVYRYDRLALGARTAKFYLNDVPAFDLDSNGYSWLTLSPGTYHLAQRWSSLWMGEDRDETRLILMVGAGETIYVSFDTNRCPSDYGMLCLSWKLKRMSEYLGPKEIANKKFQENFGLKEIAENVEPE